MCLLTKRRMHSCGWLTWLQKTLIIQNGEAIDEEEDRLQDGDPVSVCLLIFMLVLCTATDRRQKSSCPH